jgi:hypothetical protein
VKSYIGNFFVCAVSWVITHVGHWMARQDIFAHIAQLVEHFLGKEEVSGSSPDMGSIFRALSFEH